MSLSTSLPSSNGGFRDQSVARPKVFWVSALRHFFTSSHVDLQKLAKSWVTCTGRCAGDSKWRLSA